MIQTVKKEKIVRSLREAGIAPGDLIFLHSSLSSIGTVEGGADTVIDAFLEVLGEEGTLAVSAMSSMSPFDAATAPVSVGIISEKLRKRPDAFRSLRPVHSVAAVGKKAKWFTEGHEDCETNCGAGSPYLKLREAGGKIVLLGVDMNRNTTLHAVEDIMDSPYLEVREVDMPTYVADYKGKRMQIPKYPPGHRDFLRLSPLLRKKGAMTEWMVGSAVLKVIDAAAMFEITQKALALDPMFLMCENPACSYCSKARVAFEQSESAKEV
jgi:aminoglycoside 3-N-acetyltransferase